MGGLAANLRSLVRQQQQQQNYTMTSRVENNSIFASESSGLSEFAKELWLSAAFLPNPYHDQVHQYLDIRCAYVYTYTHVYMLL